VSVTARTIFLAFVCVNYDSIFEVLWNGGFLPDQFSQVDKVWKKASGTKFKDICRGTIDYRGLSIRHLADGPLDLTC